jgi:hypothetical protein
VPTPAKPLRSEAGRYEGSHAQRRRHRDDHGQDRAHEQPHRDDDQQQASGSEQAARERSSSLIRSSLGDLFAKSGNVGSPFLW